MTDQTQNTADGYPDDLSQLSVDDDVDEPAGTESNDPEPEPETKPEPKPEPFVDPEKTERGEVPTKFPDKVGLAKDGLTTNETITLVGLTVASYTLAYGVLFQMTIHGIHHAPILLWFSFSFLILLPIGILYGMGVLHTVLRESMSIRRNNTETHDE